MKYFSENHQHLRGEEESEVERKREREKLQMEYRRNAIIWRQMINNDKNVCYTSMCTVKYNRNPVCTRSTGLQTGHSIEKRQKDRSRGLESVVKLKYGNRNRIDIILTQFWIPTHQMRFVCLCHHKRTKHGRFQ